MSAEARLGKASAATRLAMAAAARITLFRIVESPCRPGEDPFVFKRIVNLLTARFSAWETVQDPRPAPPIHQTQNSGAGRHGFSILGSTTNWCRG
jgi:hypothetical protein